MPPACKRIQDAGKQVCIYSSGSRKAQRLLFQYSNHGDLRTHIGCYFDTTAGHKRQASSYAEILLTLGVTDPSKVLFVTDVYEEAVAADEVGMHCIISIREGNAPLPSLHNFRTVDSFDNF